MQKLIYYRSFSVPRLTSTRCTEEVRRRLNPGSGIQDDVVDSRAQVKSRIREELFERAEVVVTLDLEPRSLINGVPKEVVPVPANAQP